MSTPEGPDAGAAKPRPPAPPPAQPADNPAAGEQPGKPDRPAEPGAPAADAVGEKDFADSAEPSLDQPTIDRILRAITGLGGIGVGGMLNHGQSAVGHNPVSIGGNVTVTYASEGEARSWSEVLTAETLARMSATYPRRTWDDELDQRLLQRPVLYLSGLAGTGRYTAACLAMDRLHAGRVAGILLAPGARITDITSRPDQLTPEHGHVLRPSAGVRPDPVTLVTLEARARKVGARVIVIGSDGEGGDLADFLFRHSPPDMGAVFGAHLTYELKERGKCLGGCDDCLGACVDRYVAECRGHRHLAAHLATAGRVDEVRHIAEAIAAGDAPAGDDLDALLSELLTARLRQEAYQILRTTPSPDWRTADSQGTAGYRRAFRIAYAVFDGEPLTQVFEAADRLVDPRGADRRPRLGWEVESLLAEGMVAPGPAGDAPAGVPRLARLRDPRLAGMVLDVAWNDWGLSERLLEWLDTLVGSDRPATYERAALVAGVLARYDFAPVYDGLVDRWAGHRRRALRTAAALAVRATAFDQRVLPLLSERIRDWVSGDSALRRDSAVRAYARGLGHVLPHHALNDLRTAAFDRVQRLNGGIAAAVAETYPSVAPHLLVGALGEWTAPAQPAFVRVHAARALVLLAARSAPDPRGSWPELLRAMADGQVPVDALARLWAPALSLPDTAFEAWRRLGYWISRADGAGQGEGGTEPAEWLLALMRELCKDSALRLRVGHHLEHVWRQQMPQSPFLARLAPVVTRRPPAVKGDPT